MDHPDVADVTVTSTPWWRRPLVLSGVLFLVGSLTLFWHVVATSPSSFATCSCSDVSQVTWFFEWVWVALSHGHDPFYSSAMFFPHGVNLLDNTSSLGLGVVMVPVTALFGPIAALNVALIASPVLSGVSMTWLARRFTTSNVAAFCAGALFGFSPLVIFHEELGHLNVTFLALVPVVAVLVHDLFWTRRFSPVRVGALLGVVLAFQFFVGSEVLVMMLLVGAVAVVVLGLLAWWRDDHAPTALRRGATGLAVAAVVMVVLLVGPVAFALWGPSHFAGAVWPGRILSNANLGAFVTSSSPLTLWWSKSTFHFLQPIYLAPGLLVGIGAGAVAFRRDRRILAALVLALVGIGFSLGPRYLFAPWHWIARWPVLTNVVNVRFASLTLMFLLVALCLVIEHVRTSLATPLARAVVAVALVVSLAPYVDDVVHVAPFAASRVWIPQWYREHAAHLSGNQVILGFPFFDTTADLLSVQAIYHMDYSVVGGTTAQWLFSRQGIEEPGYRVIWNLASRRFGHHITATPTLHQRDVVVRAIRDWHVTLIVVPFHNGPTTARIARSPLFVERWLASVLGPATRQSSAWVWDVTSLPAVST